MDDPRICKAFCYRVTKCILVATHFVAIVFFQNVKGEVIGVNDEGLAILDHFEDHPDFYERMMTDVQLLTGKQLSQGVQRNGCCGHLFQCFTY